MKNFKLFLFVALVATFSFTSCEEEPEAQNTNYVTFESEEFNFGVSIDGSSSRDIKVFAGNVEGSDRSFSIVVDTDATTAEDGSYTVPSSVTIPANTNVGLLNVTAEDANLGTGRDLVLKFVANDNDFYAGDAITLKLAQQCDFNDVTLNIIFDQYSEETSWEIRDASNTVVASNAYAAGQTSTNESFCLENGNYTYEIFDAPYADGICCTYGNGSYVLTDDSNILASGGTFGASEATSFTLNN